MLQLHAGPQGADDEISGLLALWGGTWDDGPDHGEFSRLKETGSGFRFGGRCLLSSVCEDAVNNEGLVQGGTNLVIAVETQSE